MFKSLAVVNKPYIPFCWQAHDRLERVYVNRGTYPEPPEPPRNPSEPTRNPPESIRKALKICKENKNKIKIINKNNTNNKSQIKVRIKR